MYDYIQAGMEKIEKRKQGNRYEGNKKRNKEKRKKQHVLFRMTR